jgi:hypothetical protein
MAAARGGLMMEEWYMATRKIVLAARLKPGSEQQMARELPLTFPSQALSGLKGIKSVSICQGNQMFAAIVEYEGDFEELFQAYITSPSVRAFHSKVEKLFETPPRSHLPSDLPLAGEVFRWDGKALHRLSD